MKRINPLGPAAPFLPKGAIFDIDGLMINTEQLELDFYVEISRNMGWPTPMEMLKNTIGVSDADSEIFYKKTYGADYPYKEIWTAVQEKETRLGETAGLPLKKGLLIILDKLKKLGVPLAVATSNKTKRANWKLEQCGILDRFAVLACGDEVERNKPAPDIFFLAVKKLGVEPENCIGFEDSPAGLAGLAAAQIPSVFIKDLADPSPEILATVWHQCSDLEEAARLLG